MVARLQERGASPVAQTHSHRYVVPLFSLWSPGMWAVLLLLSQLAGRPGPGIDGLPHATVLVDSGSHELVIQLPPVDVPAASHGGEAMVGLPLCQVLVPLNASLHSSRVELVDGS